MDFIVAIVDSLWMILVEAGIWLLVGFLAAGLLHVLVKRSWIERQLTGRAGVWKASMLGAPIPLCSCSVIPFAAGVRRSGASKGSSASFAISSPEIDLPAMGLTYALLGPAMAIVRPLSALISALGTGLLIDALCDRDSHTEGEAESADGEATRAASCCHTPEPACCQTAKPACCGSEDAPADQIAKPAERAWWVRSLRYSFLTLPRDLGIWMGIGLLVSAVILAAIPEGWIEANLTGGQFGAWASRGLMLLIGIPLYVCATSSTPLVAALLAAGLSPGAGLIFLLAGPATNPATMAWVLKDLGLRALLIYLAVIGVVAFGAGTLVDLAMPGGWFAVGKEMVAQHGVRLVDQLAAGVLAVVLLAGIGFKLWSRVGSRKAKARGAACGST